MKFRASLLTFLVGIAAIPFTSSNWMELAAQEIAASQIPGGIIAVAEGEWLPESNDEIERGFASKFYASLAPAVVAVRLPKGHATGFLISNDGWLITNHHIAEAGRLNANTGCRELDIHFGNYKDRRMQVDRQTYRAVVYQTDPVNDLALVRLISKPDYLKTIEPIKLAKVAPKIDADCMVIGHPSIGMLWSLRTGNVAEFGNWPELSSSSLKESFAAFGMNDAQSESTLASIPTRKVLTTSCQTEPGDAGSPLFSANGELIGVSFGATIGIESRQHREPSLHVRLAALKSLVENKPIKPRIEPPTPWPLATTSELQDTDGNGRWDVWRFTNGHGKLTGFMLDLDQDSPADFQAAEIGDEKKRERWDFEFAIRFTPVLQVFYDTNNDGNLNLTYTDINHDQRSDLTLKKQGAHWQAIEEQASSIINAQLFEDQELRQKFSDLSTD